MALTNFDDNAIVLALVAGAREEPPWRGFLRALAGRTGADEVVLNLLPAPNGIADTMRFSSRVDVAEPWADWDALYMLPVQELRMARVYALDELLNYNALEDLERQKSVLAGHNIAFARLIRFAVPGAGSGAITLTSARQEFRAADSSLLSLLAPFAGQAAAQFLALQSMRREVRVAQAAMARFGIAAFALDNAARVVSMPDAAEAGLHAMGVRYDRARQSLNFAGADALAGACLRAQIAPQWVALAGEDAGLLLIADDGQVIAIIRQRRGADHTELAALLTTRYALSAKEAHIAAALVAGETLSDAGRTAGLTEASTRIYSKRIFAKMGVGGQGELIRLVLNSALAAV